MGALERMRDELGRARRRGSRVLMPEAAVSPMDLNPTLEVSAAIIADCVAEAAHLRAASGASSAIDLPVHPAVDRGMTQAAAGVPRRTARCDPA